ncbi:hypothetical protein [Roseburia hominis]|uniref:hypothetical protein n=1 Tax=Roseburia hominis TaxID=301301 RepID=UPI003AF5C58E
MTEENIRKMVEKYEIKDNRDGRIRAYHVKTDEEKKQIGEHKAEILAYLKREEEKKEEEYLRKTSFFESIPGVKEIRKAREEWRDYQFEFQRAFERGTGRYPDSPSIDAAGIKKLEEQYPEAVFALDMEYKKGSANYELAGIAEKAYNALCNGEAWEAVKKQYDKDNDEFVLRHVWD